MLVDYNLVVIGASEAGIYAAIAASQLKARVALVDQGHFQQSSQPAERLRRVFWHHMGITLKTLSTIDQFGLNLPRILLREAEPLSIDGSVVDRGLAEALLNWQADHSPAALSALGIDVVSGIGQFCRQPSLAFQTGDRILRGRTYLLAIEGQPRLPTFEGLQHTPHFSLNQIHQFLQQPSLPNAILIIGGENQAVESAQILSRLGCQVTLVAENPSLLSREDTEISQLIQVHLEAEGVKILLGTTIRQIKVIQGQTWVQAGNQAIVTDTIFLETDYEPDFSTLNLDIAKVRWGERGIRRNRRLQTSNPRIYSCEAGPKTSLHRAIHEVNIILKNALFAPIHRPNYAVIANLSLTDPPLASLGMTEDQARKKYGNATIVLRSTDRHGLSPQIWGETNSFGKVIAHQNGKILGAHILSPQAPELIATIALAMQQNLPISALATLPYPIPSQNELLQNIVQQWQVKKLERSSSSTNWLESWHNLRRSWFTWLP